MTWKHLPHYWCLCEGKAPVTGGFPSQRASDAELWCKYQQTAVLTVQRQLNWNPLLLNCRTSHIFFRPPYTQTQHAQRRAKIVHMRTPFFVMPCSIDVTVMVQVAWWSAIMVWQFQKCQLALKSKSSPNLSPEWNTYLSMYGRDILCGISKICFEIPLKISYPYTERHDLYTILDFFRALGFKN